MKNKQLLLPKILLLFGLFFLIPNQSEAQFLKKLKEKAEKKIEREAEKRAERRVNKKIDKEFDKAEGILDGKSKEKTTENEGNSNKNLKDANNSNNTNVNDVVEKSNKPNVVWSRFDFIPGDEVIYEDEPSTDEENGEFPSRWDLNEGNAEIINVDGTNVISFPQGGSVVPYLKNAKDDYLPEIFTIEFDAYFRPEYARRIFLDFFDKKNQRNNENKTIHFYNNSVTIGDSSGTIPDQKGNWSKNGGWRHFSIAYTKGKLKVYIDETRLINIPHANGNPKGITFEMDGYAADKPEDIQYMKNFRIAKGGVKYYDRVLSEGKIIVNGIKFDTNKATLKPESMGPINEIYQLMVDNPTINFSVEGHTDSDGDDANNQTLSEARGKSVMDKLTEMGISESRLKYTGFGESKPIDNNTTPEGKANNRRVEFVKFSGTTSTNSTTTNNNNSAFNQLDKKTIAIKLESLPESINIPISNNSGSINGKGTIILYATSDGNLGKMEILDVDENDNHKLTVKYVTYNYNGSVLSKSNNLEIQGTYTCDLDKGKTEDVIYSEKDFHLGIQDSKTATLYNGETAILKILK
ncbi:outer membrane protein OmpA-like peptidoglycan-associated protein [Lutibacter oceani]|uniref:Outer membrane protein OmpA-like peptidoglycan-associated protein n=1 Tax=Lutibacter oceani TaxID=1853311 RepID=A0A3D9S1J8_9FLAO|nr:OmpA family protein [Lutibacter oceani]REE83734.1 outer membrane protein OmpA-like peptidoglycan-associated protein [Lutibacter oceani]